MFYIHTCICSYLHHYSSIFFFIYILQSSYQSPNQALMETQKAIIKGTVCLVKRSVSGLGDIVDTYLDCVQDLTGNAVSFQLVSATVADPNLEGRGKLGKVAYWEKNIKNLPENIPKEWELNVTFEWDVALGTPGAVIVRSEQRRQFYLKTLTLEGVPGPKSRLVFVCNSWVYSADKYTYDRVFFVNDTHLPKDTPEPLKKYREDELSHLKGDDLPGQLQEWDRVYDYAYYNDLGNPDSSEDLARPVLGGSMEYPYPRRGRTSRPPTNSDPNSEEIVSLLSTLDVYVPPDEKFDGLKSEDVLTDVIKAIVKALWPGLDAVLDDTPNRFDSLQDMHSQMYDEKLELSTTSTNHNKPAKCFPIIEVIKKVFTGSDGFDFPKYSIPQVIRAQAFAWRSDEEFGREMLAGMNPVVISRLQTFPPTSKLDERIYGDQTSKITEEHIKKYLNGLSPEEAIKNNRMYILNHHDALIPYLNRINSTDSKVYASRTLLFLQQDGTLKPVAIELSLPHEDVSKGCASQRVFTPAEEGVEGSVWQLAKAYAAVNDSGVHQLISHWLNTHASIEPFVIATNRQLSVVHPIHKLLNPHYRDTMNINALARQVLISANGIVENTQFPGKYSMEMSSAVYKNWKFTEQSLPSDLLKRGVAVEDPTAPNKIRLLIEDYPYAVDGLAIWGAIEAWVNDYCRIYYPTDAEVKCDEELIAWWREIRQVGHGDKKDETWWPKLDSVSNLTYICSTIIWVASALHAAVNFGQYPYGGYLPNRPTISRKFMPEAGSDDYKELERDPDNMFLEIITSQLQTLLGVSVIEILSRHSSDEVYLGQRDTKEWTSDSMALDAFKNFGKKLVEIEGGIVRKNMDKKLKNRNGPVKMPYTLLYPNTSDFSGVGGVTGKGIPNSVSI